MSDANFTIEELEDGSCMVRDVPIFATCEKAGFDFGEAFVDDAVAYHQAVESNKGGNPFHIQHNGQEGVKVLPGGAWRNTRKVPVRSKFGTMRPGVIVDLWFTDRHAAERAKKNQLLWRSVEIPKDAALGTGPARFRSLALLDRDMHHVDDLPLMTVHSGKPRVQSWKDGADEHQWTLCDAEPVLAFHADDEGFVVLMEPEAMPNTRQIAGMTFNQGDGIATITDSDGKTVEWKRADLLRFMDGEGDSDGGSDSGGESGGGEGGSDWKSKIEDLMGVDVPADEIPDFVTALREFADSLVGEPEPAVDDETAAAGEGALEDELGDVGMSDEEETVNLKAEIAALKKANEDRDARDALNAAVAEVMPEMERRGITRDDVIAFADEAKDPVKAVGIYAKQMCERIAPSDASFDDVLGRADGSQDVPDAVLKFQNDGPEVYAWAQEKARKHAELTAAGACSMSLDRYLHIHNPKNAGAFVRATTED